MPDVWYWHPNAIREVLEFNTDIRRSRQAESRDSYKDATQKLSFNYTALHTVSEEMNATFKRNTSGVFEVPEWPVADVMKSGAIALGQTLFSVIDEAVYQSGNFVFIGNGKSLWERLEISNVTPGQIETVTGSSRQYDASLSLPVMIAPLRSCLIPGGLKFSSRYKVSIVSLEFLSTQPIDIAENTYPLFEGLPIVTDGRMSFSALSGSVQKISELIDSGFGTYDIVDTEDFIRRSGQISFFDNDFESRMVTRKFLHFMRGRDGECWVRTGQRDLNLLSSFSSSSISLSVRPIATASEMTGQYIYIKEGSNFVAKEILSAIDVSPTEQTLQVSAMGFNGSVSSMVMFMTRCRFDQDEINLQHFFTGSGLKSSTVINVIEVP